MTDRQHTAETTGRRELKLGMCVRWGVQRSTQRGFLKIRPLEGEKEDSHGKRIPRGRSRGWKLVQNKNSSTNASPNHRHI